jgi:glycosyltransferase involved in cell wall biosynthesis
LTADVDIVDAWLIPSMIFAAFAQPFAMGPVLLGGRRSLGDVYATKSRLRRVLATAAARRMTAIVANSRIAAMEARQIDGIAADRVRVIPNAVVPAVTDDGRRAATRAGWGFDDGHLVVGCVGNYKPGKGLLSLLTVADQLRHERPDLRYVLVGEGPLRSDLEQGIQRLALDDVVVLHGRETNARSLYGSFDIFVQASESEGLPNVILEAAASGLPIVATSVGGTSEILSSNVDGILVPKGDVQGIASAVSRLAADPVLRERLGRAAVARSADYAPARLAESTAAIYRGLLGRDAVHSADRDDRSASIDA